MTDLRSAIYDDIEEYEALCAYYGEKVVMRKSDNYRGPDPYCKHANELLKKHWNNIAKKRRKKQ